MAQSFCHFSGLFGIYIANIGPNAKVYTCFCIYKVRSTQWYHSFVSAFIREL